MTRTISCTLMLTLCTVFACDEPRDSTPALGAQTAAVNEVPLLIDDFRTGLEPTRSLVSSTDTRVEAGSMLGGFREIYFQVNADVRQQPSSYTIYSANDEGGLVISSGLRSYWGMYVIYGVDANEQNFSVDLNSSGHDRVCLNFGSSDQPVSGGVQFYKDGAYATANWYAPASTNPFSIAARYVGPDTEFDNPTLPWDGVDQFLVLLQVANATAGQDLELKSITLGSGACPSPEPPAL
jgi:hypothetical protein